MFAKVKERIDANRPTGRTAPASEGRSMPSIIGPDMTINGNLQTPGEVHVEGRIDGDIGCSKLTVGPTGWVRGCVTAVSARIHGHVTGAIHAEEVFLLSGSEVVGDIVQDALEIAPGASFEGRVHRRRAGESLSSMPAIAPPLVPAADPAPGEPEVPAAAGPAPVAATAPVPATAALQPEQADISVNETKITHSAENVDSPEQSNSADETIADEPASSPAAAESSGNGGAGRPVKGKTHANGHGHGQGNGHARSSTETRPDASLAAE